jgi:hypothetical protein
MAREVTTREEARLVGPGRKYSPTRLRLLLKYLAEMPVKTDACRRAGISTATLRYWIRQSEGGHPAFQALTVNGETMKFHEWIGIACDDGLSHVEVMGHQLASGKYKKVLTYQGRVIYRNDPELIALGFEGEQAYLLDEHGKPIPETVEEVDPDMVRFMLERLNPGKYKKVQEIDVNHTGGVLVVGATLTKEQFADKFVGKRPDDEPTDVDFEVVEPEDPTAAEGNPDD